MRGFVGVTAVLVFVLYNLGRPACVASLEASLTTLGDRIPCRYNRSNTDSVDDSVEIVLPPTEDKSSSTPLQPSRDTVAFCCGCDPWLLGRLEEIDDDDDLLSSLLRILLALTIFIGDCALCWFHLSSSELNLSARTFDGVVFADMDDDDALE
jgi:hypothetical protein